MLSRAVLVRHPLAIVGAVLTTVSAVVFIALAIAVAVGMLNNPYAGLLVFIALPAFVVLGLLLIPLGMRLQARKLRQDPTAVADWWVVDFRRQAVRRTALALTALTAVNLVLLLLGGYGTLHWMESPSFCGQVCHEPMHPQFTAWQANAHSRVTCTQCHIGEGARAFLHYKLVGVRQLYHVITNQIPKPIPGVADMRPALEICGTCHTPERGFPDRVRVIREYADDEPNTETTTVLQMHLGGPGQPTRTGRAIHWHADPRVKIEYVATDADRQTIPYVKVTDERGQVREYTSVALLSLVSLASPMPAWGQPPQLHLVSTAWPPFTNAPGQPRFALDLVEEALERISVTSQTAIVDEARFTPSLLNTEFDGSAAIWKDAERERALVFSEPYLENRLLLVGRRGSDVSAKKLAELNGKRIVLVGGYSYGDEVQNGSGPTFIQSRSEEDSLARLLANEADYTLMDELVVENILDNHGDQARSRLQVGSTTLIVRPLHLAIRRSRPDAAALVNRFNGDTPVRSPTAPIIGSCESTGFVPT